MNIVRIEQGGSRGYQLKWAGGSKWFSDRKHGGQAGAHKAAEAMLEIETQRIADAQAHAAVAPRVQYKTNTSGVRNASIIWRKSASGNESLYCQARFKSASGKWNARAFSVHLWGIEAAIRQALAVHNLSPGDEAAAIAKLAKLAKKMMRDIKPPKVETRARKTATRAA
jgi:hypothetical protein